MQQICEAPRIDVQPFARRLCAMDQALTVTLTGDGPMQEDPLYTFFHRDTEVRVQRLLEYALGYCVFSLLLCCRWLRPGGCELWEWIRADGFWWLMFAPLFMLDWRNVVHWRYLSRNATYFTPFESVRFAVLTFSEIFYKVLLCFILSIREIRESFSLKVVMMPYIAGYVAHFVLGHIAPADAVELPESCNVVVSLLSEFINFMQFVLIVVLSLKIDNDGSVPYNWEVAFWPFWGLDGTLFMFVLLLLPILLISIFINQSQLLMLSWVLTTGLGFSLACGVSLYHVCHLLDTGVCIESASWPPCGHHACTLGLKWTLLPWLCFFPLFITGTLLVKTPLTTKLHNAWYHWPQTVIVSSSIVQQEPPCLPPPEVMFRVTPTYYTRSFDPLFVDTPLSLHSSGLQSANTRRGTPNMVSTSWMSDRSSVRSTPLLGKIIGPWLDRRHARRERRDPTVVSVTRRLSGSVVASEASVNTVRAENCGSQCTDGASSGHRDVSSSILSARGSCYQEVVASDNVCYICYEAKPDAIFLECGHGGMCTLCALELKNRRQTCPICRGVITHIVRVRPDPVLDCIHQRPLSFCSAMAGSIAAPAYGSPHLFQWEVRTIGDGVSVLSMWPDVAQLVVVKVMLVGSSDVPRASMEV